MGMRTVNDPYGDPSVLVDTVFGTSYDVVRCVANNIDYVKKVSNLFDTSDTIVSNIHQRYVSVEGQNEFELPVTVVSEAFVTVFVNGKWRSPSVIYSATDTTLLFNQALDEGDVVDVMIVSGETFDVLQKLKEDAEQSVNKAQEWAEAPEDTEVEAGQYSAKHYSAKTSAQVVLAVSAADRAEAAAKSYPSRTAAMAAEVSTSVMRISVINGGRSLGYIRDAAGTALTTADGAKWSPDGTPTPQHFGSFGRLKTTNPAKPYLLSDVYATLAAAQAVYPKATALTQTVDDMACQAMIDYLRGNVFQALGGEEINSNTTNNLGLQITYLWPRGTYYLTRPLDCTNIRTAHNFWEMRGEGAVIMGCTPGKTIIDFTGSRKCVFTGVATIVGVWTSDGVSRSAMQFGRPLSRVSSDSHNHTGGWEIKGRFSLAGLHNYASEDFRLGALSIKNDLDHRVFHCYFDRSDNVLRFTSGETVTWGASTGVVKFSTPMTDAGQVAIRHVTGTALVDGDVIVGRTSGKSATINGAPTREPLGEGPGGRSYCMVQDGDNYWGLMSDYQPNPLPNTAASFLRNLGTVDLRHTGNGDALWICQASNHDYRNSYLVSDDTASGAAVVAFSNTSTVVLDGCLFDVHIESDMGDLDPTTGLDFGFLIDSANAVTEVTINNHLFRTNTVHPSLAVYYAAANVGRVKFTMSEIEIEGVNRNVGQILFRPPGKFSFYGGRIICGAGAPFLNLSNLANIGGCEVICPNITSANVRHATGKYLLMGLTGGMALLNGLDEGLHINSKIDGTSPILTAVSSVDGSVLGRMQYNDASSQWTLSVVGTDPRYVFANTALYPATGGAINLGLINNPWLQGIFVSVRSNDYRDENGVKVLGIQRAAVQDLTVTATLGALPTINRVVTIANAAAPTNVELLKYCQELENVVGTILARLRSHGLIAT